MGKKKKKKRPFWRKRFYRIYLGFVALFLILIFFGCAWLRGLLADYEIAQPSHVADEVEALFQSGDYRTICALDTSSKEIGDTDFYVSSLQELSAGKKIICVAGYSENTQERLYHIYLEGQKFADFTLVPSGQKTGHNQTLWTLGSITTLVTLAEPEPEPPEEEVPVDIPEETVEEPSELYRFTITVPSDAIVVADEHVLGPEYVLETGITRNSGLALPDGIAAPTYTRYGFVSVHEMPELQAASPDGTALNPVSDGNSGWTCYPEEDTQVKELAEKSVVSLAQTIAKFLTGDATKRKVLKYCADGSPAFSSISEYDNKWNTRHYGVAFQNIETSEYTLYSDGCFSCRVTFDYILHCDNKKDLTYPTSYLMCFVKDGASAKLYSLNIS